MRSVAFPGEHGHNSIEFRRHNSEGETPGPIPNPEAKPFSADGTALVTGWESRTPPDIVTKGLPGFREAFRRSSTKPRGGRHHAAAPAPTVPRPAPAPAPAVPRPAAASQRRRPLRRRAAPAPAAG